MRHTPKEFVGGAKVSQSFVIVAVLLASRVILKFARNRQMP